MDFEWDERKAAANLAKHGLSFETGVKVFDDRSIAYVSTIRETDREDRFKAIGLVESRLLTVVYTLRGATVRMISARRANRKEERSYGRRQI